ncbi:unnamed protein product, partial [Lampetra fluviatilis]
TIGGRAVALELRSRAECLGRGGGGDRRWRECLSQGVRSHFVPDCGKRFANNWNLKGSQQDSHGPCVTARLPAVPQGLQQQLEPGAARARARRQARAPLPRCAK